MEPLKQRLRESEKSSRYVVDGIARLLASGRSCSPIWKTGVNEANENPSERNLQGLIACPKARRTLAILLVFSLALFLIGKTEAQADVTSGRSDKSRNVLQAHRNPAKINMPIVDGKDIRFVRVSTADRVWQTKVSEIVQDERGFMWFATSYGLYRYDGYSFKVFVHDPRNPNSLSGVAISALFKDRGGTLWIGCDQFLNKLNPETETFTQYPVRFVTHISQDKEGTLWLATSDGGLYGLDPATRLISHYSHDPHNPSTLSSDHVIYSGEDSAGKFWVATPGCLDQFDRRTGIVTQHIPIPEAPYGFGFYEDRFGVFWIFHVSPNPLSVLDRKTNTLTHYVFRQREPAGTAVTRVTAMLEDRRGTLWIATHGPGLLKFDREHERFIRYRNDDSDPDSLPQNDVDALFADHEGSIWAGLGSTGPVRFATKPLPFTSFVYDPGGRNTRSPFVGAIYQDRQGVLWVGTPKALNRIDRRAGSFRAYRNGGPEINTDVIAIREDNSGFLWVGTYGHGLLRFDRRTGHFKTYAHNPSNPSSLSDDFVSRLLFDHNGTLWAGTQEGLDRFDPETESFTSYKLGSVQPLPCLELVEGREGLLWVGTSSAGLLRFDPATRKVSIYQHDINRPGTLSDNRVNSVHFDRMGGLWVGTQNGLNKIDPKTMTFSVYTERNGLPGNAVGCILEDDHGYLWMSTNNGVARFNPQTAAFNNYSTADGLPGPNLTGWGACSKSSTTGEMFFGGFSGAIAFFPDKVGDASYIPPIVLTDFRLAGNEVEIGKHSPLQESISFTKDLILPHNQDIFSLTFAALSYVNPATNHYRYKLEGLERDWNEVSSDRRQVTYTTLPPGTYTFRVQGATNRGAWSEPGVALSLQILPAWWNTQWFRAVSVATSVALLWALYQQHMRQLAKQFNSRLDERISERTRIARELHDSLLQGFQGLMFRLQAVRDLLPRRPAEAALALDIALERGDKAIAEGRDTVSDLREPITGDKDIAAALTVLGEELAAQSDNGSVPCVRVLVEGKQRELNPVLRDEIYRIGREALRNAFRHARAQKIEAEMIYGDSEFLFHMRDDGIGIAPEVADRGARAGHWGLPGMRERAKSFGGKLEVWSEHGAGTEIELIVPAAIAYGGSEARRRFWFLQKKIGVSDGKQS
jgi:ligand-binding sensor domain-containing protein/signal transduction histidine kinase